VKVVPGNYRHQGDRQSQQDAFGFGRLDDATFIRHGGVLLVVCDGMGGLANGALASRAAVDAILSAYGGKTPDETIPAALERAVDEAQRAVAGISTEAEPTGTTVVAGVLHGGRLYGASLGDSRLYLCRPGQPARQLTVDDNVESLLARRGAAEADGLTEADLKDVDGGALTAYLGAPRPAKPKLISESVRPGDRILACSDGVYRDLGDKELAELSCGPDPMKAAVALVDTVIGLKRPHQDNATALIVRVDAVDGGRWWAWPQDPLSRIAYVVVGLAAAASLCATAYVAGLYSKRGSAPTTDIVAQGSPRALTPGAAVPSAEPASTEAGKAPTNYLAKKLPAPTTTAKVTNPVKKAPPKKAPPRKAQPPRKVAATPPRKAPPSAPAAVPIKAVTSPNGEAQPTATAPTASERRDSQSRRLTNQQPARPSEAPVPRTPSSEANANQPSTPPGRLEEPVTEP